MTYPYPHRNRAQDADVIEHHQLGAGVGEYNTVTAALTTTGVNRTINLPYNAWKLGGTFWARNNNRGLSLKVRPWIDHEQTILGPAYSLSIPGDVAAATVLTLAATATGAGGAVFQILGGVSGAGAATQQWQQAIAVHGLQVSVTSATALTTGTYDWEIICAPEA